MHEERARRRRDTHMAFEGCSDEGTEVMVRVEHLSDIVYLWSPVMWRRMRVKSIATAAVPLPQRR